MALRGNPVQPVKDNLKQTKLPFEEVDQPIIDIPDNSTLVETKEGVMKAFPNDWIIKEAFPTGDRDFYPCKNEIFINTYESCQEK